MLFKAGTPNPSPVSRKKLHNAKNSPRLNCTHFQIIVRVYRTKLLFIILASRLSSRSKSPDHMSTSCYNTSSNLTDNSFLMTQSLDPSILSQTNETTNEKNTTNGGLIERCLDGEKNTRQTARTRSVMFFFL